jgi:hypothetical protein
LYAIVSGQIGQDTLEKIDSTDENDSLRKIEINKFLPDICYLGLYHGNLKTIQTVKETADDVATLVYPKMIHYAMVYFYKALCAV